MHKKVNQCGLTLLEVMVVLLIGVAIIVLAEYLFRQTLEKQNDRLAAKEFRQLSVATDEYLSIYAGSNQAIQNISLTQLKKLGFLPSNFPSDDPFSQNFNILFKNVKLSSGDIIPYGMIITNGGGQLPFEELLNISSQIGIWGGYIKINDQSSIKGSTNTWSAKVSDWTDGALKPEPREPLMLVIPEKTISDQNNIVKISHLTLNCIADASKLSPCNGNWYPLYSSDYLRITWNTNQSSALVELKIEDLDNKSMVLDKVIEQNGFNGSYDYYPSQNFVAAYVDENGNVVPNHYKITLTPMHQGSDDTPAQSTTLNVGPDLEPFATLNFKTKLVLNNYSKDSQPMSSGSCTPTDDGIIHYVSAIPENFTLQPKGVTSDDHQLNYIFPINIQFLINTDSTQSSQLSADLYQKTLFSTASLNKFTTNINITPGGFCQKNTNYISRLSLIINYLNANKSDNKNISIQTNSSSFSWGLKDVNYPIFGCTIESGKIQCF